MKLPLRFIKRGARTIQVTSIFVCLWDSSFFYRPFPTEIDRASGRIYAISNHGSVKYMNRTEWLEHNVSLYGGAGVGILAILVGQWAIRRGNKSIPAK
jgi:hypothetical protein